MAKPCGVNDPITFILLNLSTISFRPTESSIDITAIFLRYVPVAMRLKKPEIISSDAPKQKPGGGSLSGSFAPVATSSTRRHDSDTIFFEVFRIGLLMKTTCPLEHTPWFSSPSLIPKLLSAGNICLALGLAWNGPQLKVVT